MPKTPRSLPQAAADIIDSALGLVCSLPAGERPERRASIQAVVSQAISWRELENGVSFSFDNSDAIARSLLDLVLAERHCCAQFTYSIVFEHQHQPIELRVQASGQLVRLLKGLFVSSQLPPAIKATVPSHAHVTQTANTRKARMLGGLGVSLIILLFIFDWWRGSAR